MRSGSFRRGGGRASFRPSARQRRTSHARRKSGYRRNRQRSRGVAWVGGLLSGSSATVYAYRVEAGGSLTLLQTVTVPDGANMEGIALVHHLISHSSAIAS
jgi:hypothetical protein